MSETGMANIVDMYKRVMSEIVGGKVFGETITGNDTRVLVVAAYLYGMHKNDLVNADDIEVIGRELHNRAVFVDKL